MSFYFLGIPPYNAVKELIMKTRKVENGLALLGAIFILVAVAFAATSALNNPYGLEFLVLDHTTSLVAQVR